MAGGALFVQIFLQETKNMVHVSIKEAENVVQNGIQYFRFCQLLFVN